MIPAAAKQELMALAGPRGYLDRPEDLLLYEYDAGVDTGRPDLVVFPRSTEDVVAIMKVAHRYGVAVVGRGAGTGLSGGSIPVQGGIVVAFSRMNRILAIDLENERAVVEAGVVNLDVTLAVEGRHYFFAPDPSSQKSCTIGGNAGYDLTGFLTGSEGTLALVTKVVLRLMRKPECVKTALAIYDAVEDAGQTATRITARGITPVAVEMLHGVMLRMVEEATHAGYPMDAAAVLLIEVEGLREAVEEQIEQVREACLESHAREFRVAQSEAERDLLWKGRKNAFGAVGRVSPTFYVQDGVVPRTEIAPTLRFIERVAQESGLTISNIFHAGDGNMHPVILFDARRQGDLEKARAAGERILRHCIAVGGAITGEHGVGMEKNELLAEQFSAETIDLLRAFKLLFDPAGRFNPGKLLPTGRGCAEIRA